MRASVLAAALLFVPGLALSSLGANPLDNDAGSGGDAGDAQPFALPLELGTYPGRVTQRADGDDWYAFEVKGGTFVRFGLQTGFWYLFAEAQDSAGNVMDFRFVGTAYRTYIVRDDTWFVHVSMPLLATSNGQSQVPLLATYTLVFEEDTPAYVSIMEPSLGWGAMEVRWTEAANVTAVRRIDDGSGSVPRGAPYACTTASEGTLTGPDYEFMFQGAMRRSGASASDTMRVTPSPLPEQHVPVPTVASLPGFGYSMISGPQATGSVRFSSYCTPGVDSTVRFIFTSDRPFEVATSEGEGVLTWNEYNAGTDLQILTPVASVTPAREMIETLDGSFLGVLTAPPGVQVYADDPSGQRHVPRSGNAVFFADAEPGDWTLHVGQTTNVGLGTFDEYFDGAWIPFLGLSKPVVFPMS